ncbi:MAG: hypothetical protein KDD82_28560 [Planctomycetes bacterium]|nr:hypothetical protein [Planctomycetota bacterium]
MPRYVHERTQHVWEISLDGTRVTRSATDLGPGGTVEFPDERTAQAAMKMNIALMVGDGYRPVAAPRRAPQPRKPRTGLAAESEYGPGPLTRFVGRPVLDYDPEGPGRFDATEGAACRVGLRPGEDGTEPLVVRLQQLAADEHAVQLEALVVGPYDPRRAVDGQAVLDGVLALARVCPNLEALFLGDLHPDWGCRDLFHVRVGDWGPLLQAFPRLAHLRVRGHADLGPLRSDSLRSLCVQTMTSSRSVQSVAAANVPRLEHLELWLGDAEYGGDSGAAELEPILSGKRFPNLRYLGLRNAGAADLVAQAVANAPILEQIRTLDLSLGALTDRGAEALLASPAAARLERLDLRHNRFTQAVADRLRQLGPEVDLDPMQLVGRRGLRTWGVDLHHRRQAEAEERRVDVLSLFGQAKREGQTR